MGERNPCGTAWSEAHSSKLKSNTTAQENVLQPFGLKLSSVGLIVPAHCCEAHATLGAGALLPLARQEDHTSPCVLCSRFSDTHAYDEYPLPAPFCLN